MAFFPGRSRVERNRSTGKITSSHQRRSFDMQSTTRFGTSRFSTLCVLTLTAAGLLVMPAAQAQQQSPSGPSSAITPSPPTPTNIPDKKLDAAAATVKKVSVIQNTYHQQLAQAPVTENQPLEHQADDAIAQPVTHH